MEERKLENKEITILDCENLYKRFMKYTETAEQHQFVLLLRLQQMMENSLNNWKEKVDQKEAQSMFRVVENIIGKDK